MFSQLLLNGIISGSIYALAALHFIPNQFQLLIRKAGYFFEFSYPFQDRWVRVVEWGVEGMGVEIWEIVFWKFYKGADHALAIFR